MILIPKIIHFIWIGDKPLSKHKKNNIKTYKRLNPEWEIKLWTNNNLPEIINKYTYNKVSSWAAKADVLRLEILYRYGGIYTDIDSKCLKPLNMLINNMRCFGMTGNHGNVANGTLGCIKKHKVFKKIVYGLDKHTLNLEQKYKEGKCKINIFSIAGTRYISPILRKDKDFRQIDYSKKKRTRRYICTHFEKNLSQCYIYHELDLSWKGK